MVFTHQQTCMYYTCDLYLVTNVMEANFFGSITYKFVNVIVETNQSKTD